MNKKQDYSEAAEPLRGRGEVNDGFDDKTYLKQTELQLGMNSTVYLAESASATCPSVPAGYARNGINQTN